jgi:hypothetical protein
VHWCRGARGGFEGVASFVKLIHHRLKVVNNQDVSLGYLVSEDPEQDFLKRLFRFLFGSFAPLAREIYHHAMTFIFIAVSLFIVRGIIEYLFPPSDELRDVLHFIDLYGNALGLIGFIVWMTLGIGAAIINRLRGGEDESE